MTVVSLKDLFNDMIELEKENLSPILSAYGRDYDCRMTLYNFEKDYPDSSTIIYYYKNEILVAYLAYCFDTEKKDIEINSIQIRKGFNYYIRHLLREAATRFQHLDFDYVKTSVHKQNQASISIHLKLGFKVLHKTLEKIEFINTKATFLHRLVTYA